MEKAAKDQVCRLAMTKAADTEWINILILNARHTGLSLVMAWKRLRKPRYVGWLVTTETTDAESIIMLIFNPRHRSGPAWP